MSKKSYLDSIKSPAPCSKDWDEMVGDELVRFCSGCEKNVYNLSAMPQREAEKFAVRNQGKVCVRYVRMPNGKVQTAETELYKITRKTSRIAAGLIGATLTLSAISQAQTTVPQKNEPNETVKSKNKDYSKTSQISFTVSDITDAVIPNAEVKLINEKTKEEFITLTNQEGIAEFFTLLRGKYSAIISAEHFMNVNQTIQIREKIEPNIKVSLEVAGIAIGIFITENYEYPLFHAIVQGDNEAAKRVINSGFNVNTKNGENYTALHIAAEKGNLEMVRFLLEKGAKLNVKTSYKLTPIWLIKSKDENISKEILMLLISKGADVNVLNEDKETLLMQASENGNLEGVKILLQAGANPNLKDDDGETALQKTDSDEIKKLLISYGAKK